MKNHRWSKRVIWVVLVLLLVGCKGLQRRKSGRDAPKEQAGIAYKPEQPERRGGREGEAPQLGRGTFAVYQVSPLQPVAWAWKPDTGSSTTEYEYWALLNTWAYPGEFWQSAFLDICWEGDTQGDDMPHDQTVGCFIRWITEKYSVSASNITLKKHTITAQAQGTCSTQQYPRPE